MSKYKKQGKVQANTQNRFANRRLPKGYQQFDISHNLQKENIRGDTHMKTSKIKKAIIKNVVYIVSIFAAVFIINFIFLLKDIDINDVMILACIYIGYYIGKFINNKIFKRDQE